MVQSLETSIARIMAAGHVVGAGCFIGERTVLTCAHVIANALCLPENTQTVPPDAVSLDFPRVAPGHQFSSHVILWHPPLANDGGDIAILQLDDDPPYGIQVSPFVQVEDLWQHPCRVIGFPQHEEAGVWAMGRLLGRQASSWIRIEDVGETAFPIASAGFSGTPVWDNHLQAVVGIIVVRETPQYTWEAFLIPTDVLVHLYQPLQAAIQPLVFIIASEMDREYVSQLSADLQNRGILARHGQLDNVAHPSDRQEAIRETIRAVQVVFLVAAPHTRTSQEVREQLRIVSMYQRHLQVIWVAGNELMETLPHPSGAMSQLSMLTR